MALQVLTVSKGVLVTETPLSVLSQISVLHRLSYIVANVPVPTTSERFVTPYDKNFFWLVQRTALEHVALKLEWHQIDTDATEFILRILMAVSIYKKRNTLRDERSVITNPRNPRYFDSNEGRGPGETVYHTGERSKTI